MLQYVTGSKLATLAAMAALFALTFLVFGCGGDTPTAIDISAIATGINAQIEQTIGEGAAAST